MFCSDAVSLHRLAVSLARSGRSCATFVRANIKQSGARRLFASARRRPRARLILARSSSTCYSSTTGRRDDPIPPGAERSDISYSRAAPRRRKPSNAPEGRDDDVLLPCSPQIRRAPTVPGPGAHPRQPLVGEAGKGRFPSDAEARANPRAALARSLVSDPSSPHIRSAPGPYPSGFLDPDAPLDAPSRVARASCCA